jgi:hypothetical protein
MPSTHSGANSIPCFCHQCHQYACARTCSGGRLPRGAFESGTGDTAGLALTHSTGDSGTTFTGFRSVFPDSANTPDSGMQSMQMLTSEKDLAQLAADWPGSRLVDIWNRIPGLTPV